MEPELLGIHHVTAIASDPQQNIDFYAGTLGLRLVKVTINYDDPGSYHFYYGDETGTPGSIITFFAWPGGSRGRRGSGQATATSFAVPQGALGYWRERLEARGVNVESVTARFAEEALTFYDPDGLQLELVAHPSADRRRPWTAGGAPEAQAIRGFHSITLVERALERTDGILTRTLGIQRVQSDRDRHRYLVGPPATAQIVDIVESAGSPPGRVAVGTVHHIAWRTPDDDNQRAWHGRIERAGYGVSPVMDRQYFHSIYFREPGGVLFEIATDPPGFTADESVEHLGAGLRLPEWLEPQRHQIEQILPPIRRPERLKEAN
jgi:glyoxalase family protein